jgi:hypothetical protein
MINALSELLKLSEFIRKTRLTETGVREHSPENIYC